jgi:uncharacterized protein YndB with AHSA1/START domain
VTVAAVTRSVEVPVDPGTAFRLFTDDIGAWYRGGAYSWNDPERAVGIRFEPGVGGRLLELYDDEARDVYEMGRVLAWEPGERLVFEFQSVHFPPDPLTEVEVRFQSVAGGTRVTLEHRGLDRLPPAFVERVRDRAWVAFMRWFAEYVAVRGRR